MATVLIVNNEPALQGELQKFLGKLGVTVLAAATTEEAIEICRTYQGIIHVVMTDLTLPGINGPRLAAYAATLRPHIAIVLVSAESPLNEIHPDVLPPNTIRLNKPFKLEALEVLLRDLLKDVSYLFTSTSFWVSPERGDDHGTCADT